MPFNPATALEGSYKGFSFKIADERGEGGRRGQLHQYPDQDAPFFEDLGSEARKREFSVYFVGPLADFQANRFDELLWKGGSGPLVLPGYRRETALAVKWAYRKGAGKANWVEFQVSFVDPGRNAYPEPAKSWSHSLLQAALDARTAFADAMGEAFGELGDAIGLDDGDTEGLLDRGQALGAALDVAVSLAAGESPATALAAAAGQVSAFTGDLAPTLDVVTFAGAAVGLLGSWSDALAGPSPDGLARSRTVEALFSVYDDTLAGSPEPYDAGAVGERAFDAGIRRTALAEISRQAASLAFVSYDDAAGLRSRLADAFELEIDLAGDVASPGGFNIAARGALQALRTAALEAISAAGADKARLVPYAVARPRPALALAQLFYGGDRSVIDRAAELAARTGAIHPAFLPATGERLSS